MIDVATRGAWRELEATLRPFVARRVRAAADVDDVIQDVLLRLHRSLDDLRDEQRFGAWVFRVARSAVIDHHRRARRRPPLEGDFGEQAEDSEAVGDAEEVLASYVAPFVAMLPSPYREALTLTELEGLTQKKAAEMLGISLSGMKTRVQRGRLALRRVFEDCCTIALDRRGRVIACEPRPDGRLPACRCERPRDARGLRE